MKKKIKTGLFHFIKYDGITAAIAAIIVLVVIFIKFLKNERQIEIMDWTIFTSIVVAMLMKQLADMIRKRLMNKLEDSVKLTTNYDLLASKYTTNGPFFPALEESCLSNHLGFNGFVESSDGFIVFVKRKKQISIGKGTYGNSIGACLKTKYALDGSGNFTEAGLRNGILQNIENELKIPKSYLADFSIKEHIIAAYRDMVEGGKPQLLFFIRSSWDKDTIMQNFTTILRTAGRRESEEAFEDGAKLLWIPKTELKEMCILPDRIIRQGKSYSMMPSASASIVMLLKHLSEQK